MRNNYYARDSWQRGLPDNGRSHRGQPSRHHANRSRDNGGNFVSGLPPGFHHDHNQDHNRHPGQHYGHNRNQHRNQHRNQSSNEHYGNNGRYGDNGHNNNGPSNHYNNNRDHYNGHQQGHNNVNSDTNQRNIHGNHSTGDGERRDRVRSEPPQHAPQDVVQPPVKIKREANDPRPPETTSLDQSTNNNNANSNNSNNSNNNNSYDNDPRNKTIGGLKLAEWDELSRIDAIKKFDELSQDDKLNLLIPTDCVLADVPPQIYPADWDQRCQRAVKETYVDILDKVSIDDPELPEFRRFLQMLPRCPTMTMGFNIPDICDPTYEKWCACPCGTTRFSKRWQFYFRTEGFVEDDRHNVKCTFKDARPAELVAHLKAQASNHSFIHEITLKYLEHLYQNHYGENIPHLAFCFQHTEQHVKALKAKNRRIDQQMTQLKDIADEATKKLRGMERIEAEKARLQQINSDLLRKSKEKDLLLKQLEEEKKEEEVFINELRMKEWKQHFDNTLTVLHSLHAKKNGTFTIHVDPDFDANSLFKKFYTEKSKHPLFDPDVAPGTFFKPLKVVYSVGTDIKLLSKVKKELQAVDEGGPTRQFFSTLWKTLGDVTVNISKGKGISKELKLFESSDVGWSPTTDDNIANACGIRDPSDMDAMHQNKWVKKAMTYYRAIGRLFALCMLSCNLLKDEPAGGGKQSAGLSIQMSTVPKLFRNFLFRGVKPSNPSYSTRDLILHTLELLVVEKNDNDEGSLLFRRLGIDEEECKNEKKDKWKVARQTIEELYIDGRSIALTAIQDGLTLGGNISPSLCFPMFCPPKVLDSLLFARDTVTIDDFLGPNNEHLLLEGRVPADGGMYRIPDEEAAAYAERAEKFMQVFATLLRSKSETDSAFLSRFLLYCTGQTFLPDLNHHSNFRIHVEITKENRDSGSLPTAHTCTQDLLIPYSAYGNDIKVLEEKLDLALEYSMSAWNME